MKFTTNALAAVSILAGLSSAQRATRNRLGRRTLSTEDQASNMGGSFMSYPTNMAAVSDVDGEAEYHHKGKNNNNGNNNNNGRGSKSSTSTSSGDDESPTFGARSPTLFGRSGLNVLKGDLKLNTNITCDVLPELAESDLLTAGCIILEDDVTLDCDGFSIIGPGTNQINETSSLTLPDFYAGINVARKHNVRIKNCIVENFPVGIRAATGVRGPTGSVVIESTTASHNQVGIATGGETTLKNVGVEYNEDVGISFATAIDNNPGIQFQQQEAQQVVLDDVYSCFNGRSDIWTGIIASNGIDFPSITANPCVEATGQIFAGITDGTAQVCPIDFSSLPPTRFQGDVSDVINFSLDENDDGPITSCDDLFAQQEILFENDGTRAPTPAVPDPFITDEGEPCVSSRADDINGGCFNGGRVVGSFGTISFGETIQGITSAFPGGQGLLSDIDEFKFFHRGGNLSATLETSFGTGTQFAVCSIAGVLSTFTTGCIDPTACLVDIFGARDNPARSYAVTGNVEAGEYVVQIRPQRITSPNPSLSLECGGNEGTYNVTLIEGPIDISPRAIPGPI